MREFGSEFYSMDSENGDFVKMLSSIRKNILFTRSGREALSLCAKTIGVSGDDIIFAPAFCCSSMDQPLIEWGG